MEAFLTNYLTSISPDTLLSTAVILLSLCWVLLKNHSIISKLFHTFYHRQQKEEELLQAIKTNQAEIKLIIDEMQKNTDRRFAESEEKNKKRIRAELKDKISRSYRYYHSLGQINSMELEALEDLIEEYESADGQNSFVHSVVQKEMYTWKKIDQM